MRKYYTRKSFKGLILYGANRVAMYRETYDRLAKFVRNGHYIFLDALEVKVCFQRKYNPK